MTVLRFLPFFPMFLGDNLCGFFISPPLDSSCSARLWSIKISSKPPSLPPSFERTSSRTKPSCGNRYPPFLSSSPAAEPPPLRRRLLPHSSEPIQVPFRPSSSSSSSSLSSLSSGEDRAGGGVGGRHVRALCPMPRTEGGGGGAFLFWAGFFLAVRLVVIAVLLLGLVDWLVGCLVGSVVCCRVFSSRCVVSCQWE